MWSAANTCNNPGSVLTLFIRSTLRVSAFTNDIKAQIEYILTFWQRLR